MDTTAPHDAAHWARPLFADRDRDCLPVFLDLDLDIAFELIEQLLALVPMIILARVGSADHHHDEIAIVIDALIANRRLQKMPVLIDPLFEVKWAPDRHSLLPFRQTEK